MHPILHPILTWWLLASLLGLLGLPLCALVFRNFPDGGYALARALGLFLFSWLAYNIARLTPLHFSQSTLWCTLLLLLVGRPAPLWRILQVLLRRSPTPSASRCASPSP